MAEPSTDPAAAELRRALARALDMAEDDERMAYAVAHGVSIGPRDAHGRLDPLTAAQRVKDSALGQNLANAKPKPQADADRHARALAGMTSAEAMAYARQHGLT